MDPLYQKQVRFAEANNPLQAGPQYVGSGQVGSGQIGSPIQGIPTRVYQQVRPALQPVNQNSQSNQQSASKVSSAIAELRNSYNAHANKLSASRLSEQTIPMNETIQTIHSMPSNQNQSNFQGSCCHSMQPMCNCCNQQQQIIQPIVMSGSSQQKKKKKNRTQQIEEVINLQVTPKREKRVHVRDPEIDNVKREINELERIIRTIETQPPQQQQQKEIEIHIKGENKKSLKKLCKKIKTLEKELYDVARQRDESLIIRTQLDKENTEMFDRIGELEALLKAADKKIFDLSIISERHTGYVRQLEDQIERLMRKKKKRQPVKEIIVEKYVDRPQMQQQPIEIIRHVPVDRIIERPIEIIKEVIVEKIIEKIVQVPRIEYVDRLVPQYIEKIVEVPVVQRVEIPVPYDRIVEKAIDRVIYQDRIVEVPVERVIIKEVPVDRIVDRIVEKIREVPVTVFQEIPVDVVREVPYDRYIEVPYEKIVEVPTIQYIDRPVYIEIPFEKIVEIPIERRIEVPYDRVVQVPYERRVEVEVPVERIVPVDRIIETRDDREIYRLQNENRELLLELRNVRDKLEREIDIQRRDGNEEVSYLRDQLRVQDDTLRQFSSESEEFRRRSGGLEQALNREREIVSDLQQRLDQMYHEVERLASENNRKNDDMQQHILRLQDQLERRRQAPLRVAEVIQQNILTQSQIAQNQLYDMQQNQLRSAQSRSPQQRPQTLVQLQPQQPVLFQPLQPLQFQPQQPVLFQPQLPLSQPQYGNRY